MAWLLFGLAAAASAHGLITDQPTLTPQPPDPSAIPAPVTAQTPSDPSWFAWLNVALLAGSPLVIAGLWGADVIRPASFRRRTAPPASKQPWGVLLLTALLVTLGSSTALQLALRTVPFWYRDFMLSTNFGRGMVSLVVYLAGVPIALTLAGLVAARGLKGLFAWRDVPIGVLTLVLAFPVVSAVTSLTSLAAQAFSGRLPEQVAHRALSQIVKEPDDPWLRVVIAGALLGAPVVEEVIYRLMLQGAVVRLTRSAWVGILATSVLFAASHLGGGTVPWHALPALFTLAAALGIVHVRTGRLGPCIVAHMGFNLVNVVLALAAS